MLKNRAIPCLLLKGEGLVKTIRFSSPTYVGDPLNAVKLFNDLEVDELMILDIDATKENREPNFDWLRRIAGEAFMPLCYGGAVTSVEHARWLFNLGMEKISITTAASETPHLVEELAGEFGSQSIVVGIDVKRGLFGKPKVMVRSGKKATSNKLVDYAVQMEKLGAGELFVNSIDRDGTMSGYDLELVEKVSQSVSIPVVVCGGAGSVEDLGKGVSAGASGVAAGSLFVFTGPHRAVMINYPSREVLERVVH